jgi:hypothetical protein
MPYDCTPERKVLADGEPKIRTGLARRLALAS